MINKESIPLILAFLICYTGWSLLQEENEKIRRLVLLIGLVGLFILSLLYQFYYRLRSIVERVENSFGNLRLRGNPHDIQGDDINHHQVEKENPCIQDGYQWYYRGDSDDPQWHLKVPYKYK